MPQRVEYWTEENGPLRRVVHIICWDDGDTNFGQFPWTFTDENEAERWAKEIEANNHVDGIWGEDGFCVVACDLVPLDVEDARFDLMEELRKSK